MRSSAILVAGGTALAISTASAHAQSTFDCRRPQTSAASTICREPALLSRDRAVEAAFAQSLALTADTTRAEAEHGDWIGRIEACGSDRSCLMDQLDAELGRLSDRGIRPAKVQIGPTAPVNGGDTEPTPVEISEPTDKPSTEGVEVAPQETSDGGFDGWGELPAAQPEAATSSRPDAAEDTTTETTQAPTMLDTFTLALGGIGLLGVLIVVASLLFTRALANQSMERYGWPMIMNWWNVLHLVAIFAFLTFFSIGLPGAGLVVAGGLWAVLLVINIRKTNLLLGTAMTLVQPFVVFILWALYGAARAKAEGRRI